MQGSAFAAVGLAILLVASASPAARASSLAEAFMALRDCLIHMITHHPVLMDCKDEIHEFIDAAKNTAYCVNPNNQPEDMVYVCEDSIL